jgi:hypothetical protein
LVVTQFKGFAGLSEAQLRLLFSHLFKQDSTGLATDGVMDGLGVAQTTTASASVVVSAGFGVSQDSVLNGVAPLVLDTDLTMDVLVANPVGGLPRNDIVVFDSATLASGTGGVRAITGTPNASPTDPTVPPTAVPLARLRHAASATTVPAAKIDDLRTFTSLVQPTGTWVSATLASGVGGSLKYRQRGNTIDVVVDVTGSFPAGFTAASAAGAIPAAMRPAATPARCVAYVGSGTAMGSIEVTTAGTVNVQVQAGTAGLAKVQFSYPAS